VLVDDSFRQAELMHPRHPSSTSVGADAPMDVKPLGTAVRGGENRGRLRGQLLVAGGVGEVGVPAPVVLGEGVVEDSGEREKVGGSAHSWLRAEFLCLPPFCLAVDYRVPRWRPSRVAWSCRCLCSRRTWIAALSRLGKARPPRMDTPLIRAVHRLVRVLLEVGWTLPTVTPSTVTNHAPLVG
jgi:hypothetical protein